MGPRASWPLFTIWRANKMALKNVKADLIGIQECLDALDAAQNEKITLVETESSDLTAIASGTYGAPEQAMLQECFNALVALGALVTAEEE